MEKQIFDWEEFGIISEMFFMFYNCTLKQHLGLLEKGTKIKTIEVNYETGTMDFYGDDGNSIDKYNIKIRLEHV